MSLLDGGLRSVFGAAFAGLYLPGTLSRPVAGGLDEFGDPVASTPSTYPVRVQIDVYSDQVRAQAGIPEGVVKLMVLQAGVPVKPQAQDTITVGAKAYSVGADVTADPANTHWIIRASRI